MQLIYLKIELEDLSQGQRIAFAYKMKLDELKNQNKSAHHGHKSQSMKNN